MSDAVTNPLSEGFVTLTKSCVGVAKKADVSSNFWSQPRTSAAAITGIGLKQWMEEVQKSGLEIEQYNGDKCRMQRPITKATGAMRPLDEKPEKFPHRAGRGLPAFVRNGGAQPHRKSNAELTLDLIPSLERELLAHAHAHYGTDRDLPNDITRTCQLARVPLDDSEIRACFKHCKPDKNGRLSVPEFVAALQHSQQRVVSKEQREDAAFAEVPPSLDEGRFAAPPPVPSHAYSAADIPKPPMGDRGRAAISGLSPSKNALAPGQNSNWCVSCCSSPRCPTTALARCPRPRRSPPPCTRSPGTSCSHPIWIRRRTVRPIGSGECYRVSLGGRWTRCR